MSTLGPRPSRPCCEVGARQLPLPEVLVGHCPSEDDDLMVETSEVDGVERHRKSIPDPLERGGIAPATRGIAGCRVDLELTRPELKTGAVDLSGGLVAKLASADWATSIAAVAARR